VGKTLVSCALLHAWAQEGLVAAGLKPVAAGAHEHSGALGQQGHLVNDDVEQLRQASSLTLSSQQVSPYVLRTPVAPHLAARREGVHLDMQVMVQAYQHLCGLAQAVVVEGVGGFCVPLNEHQDTSDLAAQLGLPVVLVVGLRLGCINHALLTSQAIAAKGLRLAAWVANTVDAHMPELQNNVQAIHERLQLLAPVGQQVVYAGCVPRLSEPVAEAAATYLDWRGVDWRAT
jgi:dethiobiotin synthetase